MTILEVKPMAERQSEKIVVENIKEITDGRSSILYAFTSHAFVVKTRKPGIDPRKNVEFKHEIDALKVLKHDNIVRLLYVVSDSVLLLEFIDGATLAELCKECKIEWIKPIANTLAYIHDEGWFHGDLSMHNIMVTKNGIVKLIDFGKAGQGQCRTTGSFVFTPPEAYRGPIDGQSLDVYAFGVVMWCIKCKIDCPEIEEKEEKTAKNYIKRMQNSDEVVFGEKDSNDFLMQEIYNCTSRNRPKNMSQWLAKTQISQYT